MHHEVVQVVQHGSRIVATKIVGDNCVRAGHRTFEGTVHGRSGSVDYWVGLPGQTPVIGLRNNQLTVVSADRFTVRYENSVITYTRLSAASGASGAVPWWLWLLVAVATLLALGALLGRRRRRRPSSAWSAPRLWSSSAP